MTRRLIVLVLTTVAMSACAPAPMPIDTTADEAKLKAEALAWFDLYNRGDADGVANLYAEDALLMPPNAPLTTGRAAIRTFIAADTAASKAAGVVLKNTAVTGVGINGDAGWLSGTFMVNDASGKTLETGKYLSVHRRINGTWLYIRDIWNVDTPAPPPPPPPAPKK